MSIFFTLLVGIIIGSVLGLTGAGGSVFAVPLLMLLLDLTPQQAIGISLGAVCISAIYGSFANLRSQNIQWFPAITYALIGGLLAPIGSLLGKQVDDSLLLIGFSCLVLIVAMRMWKQANSKPLEATVVRSADIHSVDSPNNDDKNQIQHQSVLSVFGIVVGAALTGLLSGLFGVGGGFLIVPTLIMLQGFSMKQAVATSLTIISIISASGFFFFLFSSDQPLNFSILYLVAIGGILGMLVGTKASKKIAGPSLQKLFSIMMLLMSGTIIAKTLI